MAVTFLFQSRPLLQVSEYLAGMGKTFGRASRVFLVAVATLLGGLAVSACIKEPAPADEYPKQFADTLHGMIQKAPQGGYEVGNFAPDYGGMQWIYECSSHAYQSRSEPYTQSNEAGIQTWKVLSTTASSIRFLYQEQVRLVSKTSQFVTVSTDPLERVWTETVVDTTFSRDKTVTLNRQVHRLGYTQDMMPVAPQPYYSLDSATDVDYQGQRMKVSILSNNKMQDYVSGIGLTYFRQAHEGNGNGSGKTCTLVEHANPEVL